MATTARLHELRFGDQVSEWAALGSRRSRRSGRRGTAVGWAGRLHATQTGPRTFETARKCKIEKRDKEKKRKKSGRLVANLSKS